MKTILEKSSRFKIVAIATGVLLLGFFVLRFLPIRAVSVPSEFLEARKEASRTAEEIVSLASNVSNNLNQIAAYDTEKKYSEAVLLVSQEIERNREMRGKAILLSGKLEAMAKNLSNISPGSSGQIALEAISSETALISQLIDYNDYLVKLLENLHDKFIGKKVDNKIAEWVDKINGEIRDINDLNQKFNDLMKKFDESL